ncbi:hypothetical protein RND81_12G239100 [Saponaria officinalis]|uniref:60S ribosomal protein L18a-like protein n=1 Tax=Saponaria officinalis TaxID=3572 RepID=A0AAW1HEU8_SAPOF
MSEESRVVHHHHESNQSSNETPTSPQFPNIIEESRVIHHHHESNQNQSSFSPQFPNSSEESGVIHHQHRRHGSDQPPYDPPPPPPLVVPPYGTFEGIPTSPSIGFPQPMPPHHYYAHGYQAVPGYAIADGTPVGAYHRLPCCGLGYGWFLFIIGFFLAGVPWYAAAILFLCCGNVDPRERPAYVCCTIAAVLAIITTIFGVMSFDD